MSFDLCEVLKFCSRISPRRGSDMPAQGTALGIGSRVENSNALKGQNRFVVKNLVSPFQGWADFHSDQIPRALPWAFLFRPLRGGRKEQHQNCEAGIPGGTSSRASRHPVGGNK